MKNILHFVPWFLLYSRLATALFFTLLLLLEINSEVIQTVVLALFCFGFMGDIFDGIIARKLKMDTTKMRRLDSLFDSFFWVSVSILLYQFHPEIRTFMLFGIGGIIVFVLLEYLFCLIRFQKPPSAHNFLSKYFGLLLFVLYVLLFAGFYPIVFGVIVLIVGYIARLDSLLVYIILKKWTHDVPSCFHAKRINRGIEFKRNMLFHSSERN